MMYKNSMLLSTMGLIALVSVANGIYLDAVKNFDLTKFRDINGGLFYVVALANNQLPLNIACESYATIQYSNVVTKPSSSFDFTESCVAVNQQTHEKSFRTFSGSAKLQGPEAGRFVAGVGGNYTDNLIVTFVSEDYSIAVISPGDEYLSAFVQSSKPQLSVPELQLVAAVLNKRGLSPYHLILTQDGPYSGYLLSYFDTL